MKINHKNLIHYYPVHDKACWSKNTVELFRREILQLLEKLLNYKFPGVGFESRPLCLVNPANGSPTEPSSSDVETGRQFNAPITIILEPNTGSVEFNANDAIVPSFKWYSAFV